MIFQNIYILLIISQLGEMIHSLPCIIEKPIPTSKHMHKEITSRKIENNSPPDKGLLTSINLA